MTAIEPSGQILGATVRGVDLAKPLSDADFAAILLALGRHGVLRFPHQQIEAVELRDFSRRFGRIQATLTGRHHEPGMPEVGFLSNIIENGEPIGITDAGQDWHTDMSYNETIGFLNVLYAVKVPRRNGQVLGATAFVNTQAAYEDLPEVRARLEDMTATHDFNSSDTSDWPPSGCRRLLHSRYVDLYGHLQAAPLDGIIARSFASGTAKSSSRPCCAT